MKLADFLKKTEELVSLDIGTSGIKLLEVDTESKPPKLINISVTDLPPDVFANNVIQKPEIVSDRITSLFDTNGIGERRVITSMPGPSVFTKKIKMPQMAKEELANNVQFEASNFIPHNINDVRLDYHVIGQSGKNQLDVLVVAVKNEIVDSFLESFALAGIEAAVVDVDYFALQNCFEICYPEYVADTNALIDIGSRFSSINICQNGDSLFTGDIAIGGKLFTDTLCESLGIDQEEAEKLKCQDDIPSDKKDAYNDAIDRKVEYVTTEFNRQLSLFWNAAGAGDGIDRLMITGGGALIPGLVDELNEKTGLDCEMIDPFRGLDVGNNFDSDYLKELSPSMGVSVGLALRQPGDKEYPEIE